MIIVKFNYLWFYWTRTFDLRFRDVWHINEYYQNFDQKFSENKILSNYINSFFQVDFSK